MILGHFAKHEVNPKVVSPPSSIFYPNVNLLPCMMTMAINIVRGKGGDYIITVKHGAECFPAYYFDTLYISASEVGDSCNVILLLPQTNKLLEIKGWRIKESHLFIIFESQI